MNLTFLKASNNLALTKTIKADGTIESYPLVKNMTSVQEQITLDNEGLRKAASLIQGYGAKGYCLQKGSLKQELVNESRANKIDRTRPSEFMVIDIDGLKLPNVILQGKLTQQYLANISEEILSHFTIKEFQEVSYIAQASSSMGRKESRICLHLFFFLETPLPPLSIKLLIKQFNLTIPLFSGQLGLSENGMALRYPLDPSVTDNSHIIFIAPPKFENPTDDPFDSAIDRMALMIKPVATIDLQAAISTISPDAINHAIKLKLEVLREQSGLPKKKYKLTTTTINNEVMEVVKNPDDLLINIIDDTAYPYIRCNINHGDSRGYYFDARNPLYMYNFKGEPIWEIAKANAQFITAIGEVAESHGDMLLAPIVLRDFDTNVFYNGLFDKKAGKFSTIYPLTPTSKVNIPDFMETHGYNAPPFVPDAKVVFNPSKGQEAPNLTAPPLYVNTYMETEYMAGAMPPDTAPVYGNACNSLKQHSPLCFRIIGHMLGNSKIDIEHFLNWLAYIYQYKTKTMTAWVLSGTTGTGKGVFVNKVLKPLFGHTQVPMRSLENLEEHFNHYLQKAILLIVDEFRIIDASRGGNSGATRLTDKLKLQITEPTLAIRAMRADQVEVPSYVNFIFLTNHYDAINIEPSDRRYNVGTRQENKLQETYPNLDWVDTIDNELYHLAGWFKSYIVNVSAARTCLDNEEKTKMQQASTSLFDEFCTVLRTGRIEYFYDVLDMSATSVIGTGIIMGKKLIMGWLSEIDKGNTRMVIPIEHLRILYTLIAEPHPIINSREFTRRLGKQGITTVRKRTHSSPKATRGIEIVWDNITSEQARDKISDAQPGVLNANQLNPPSLQKPTLTSGNPPRSLAS